MGVLTHLAIPLQGLCVLRSPSRQCFWASKALTIGDTPRTCCQAPCLLIVLTPSTPWPFSSRLPLSLTLALNPHSTLPTGFGRRRTGTTDAAPPLHASAWPYIQRWPSPKSDIQCKWPARNGHEPPASHHSAPKQHALSSARQATHGLPPESLITSPSLPCSAFFSGHHQYRTHLTSVYCPSWLTSVLHPAGYHSPSCMSLPDHTVAWTGRGIE